MPEEEVEPESDGLEEVMKLFFDKLVAFLLGFPGKVDPENPVGEWLGGWGGMWWGAGSRGVGWHAWLVMLVSLVVSVFC